MSDNNLVGDENDVVAAPAPTNGSSSESSDISIEKLNPEETEVVEDKPEEQTKEEEKPVVDVSEEAKETEPEVVDITEDKEKDTSEDKDKNETLKIEDVEEKKAETISPPSTSSSSKVVAKEIASIADSDDEDDDEDDFEDETLMERLVGLSEMFPPGLITGISNLSKGSVNAVKWTYSKSRTVTWLLFSSAALLFLPAMLESERCAIEEQDKMRKQQMLLGPSSALASSQNAPLPPSPA